MEMFDVGKLNRFDVYGGVSVSNLTNKMLNQFIADYNTVNQSKLSEGFKPFRTMAGYEIGARWTIMDMAVGSLGAFRQSRRLSPITERVMDVKVSYVNAFGTFPVAKGKFWFSIGLQTIRSVYSAYLKYNNGEVSFGKESSFNGNYKGLGINGAMRMEGLLIKREKYGLGLYLHYTGSIAGTGGISTDNNAAKGALNLSNSLTSTPVKTNFNGFMLGLNCHYTLSL
ncbi:MAG: hypothetical protein JNL57_11095 [Bacteroidetes bacterium]|nr:hypothetical protein [Bacteroidota bacterium]